MSYLDPSRFTISAFAYSSYGGSFFVSNIVSYGRNTTSLFSLSSGTLGGAMEAAVCKKRAVALSYAFFSRNHDPEIIAAASGVSVRVIEHLWSHWNEAVDLYSVNVPLIEGVEAKKVLYTHALQNYWQSGSSFTEIEASGDEDEDPAEKEAEIRDQEVQQEGGESQEKRTRHKHRHFKWSPNFTDVYQSVEVSEPGNDGWAIKEGFTRCVHAHFSRIMKLKVRKQCHPIKGKFHACPGTFRRIEAVSKSSPKNQRHNTYWRGNCISKAYIG